MRITRNTLNEMDIITGENDHIKFDVVPSIGGKIISVFNKQLQKEFLWSNKNLVLTKQAAGADYDANFWGGIDELIPNDIPESIDSIAYPDHGELWTTALDVELAEDSITVSGTLPLSGLWYKKKVSAETDTPVVKLDYTIRNDSRSTKNILWKLHAALNIEAGDRLQSSAQTGQVADLDYSRFNSLENFSWPYVENMNASIVPEQNNSMDFFYLSGIEDASMDFVHARNNHLFRYTYDKNVFPYQWYFASYGGFQQHYTVILEPATGMPISVNEAKTSGQCKTLAPGEEIQTTVRIYAGHNI